MVANPKPKAGMACFCRRPSVGWGYCKRHYYAISRFLRGITPAAGSIVLREVLATDPELARLTRLWPSAAERLLTTLTDPSAAPSPPMPPAPAPDVPVVPAAESTGLPDALAAKVRDLVADLRSAGVHALSVDVSAGSVKWTRVVTTNGILQLEGK